MKPIHAVLLVGFVPYAIAIASGSMGAAVVCFALLFLVGMIAAVADPSIQGTRHGGRQGGWRDRSRFTDSGDPDDPMSIHYDPHRWDSGDPRDPSSIHYSPSLDHSDQWGSLDPSDPTSLLYDPGGLDSLDATGSGIDWDDSMDLGIGSDHSIGLGDGFDDPFESGTGLGSDWDD